MPDVRKGWAMVCGLGLMSVGDYTGVSIVMGVLTMDGLYCRGKSH